MTGRGARQKGANYERELAKILSAAWGVQAKRGIGQARSATEVSDVEGTVFWVEAKHRKNPSVHAAYDQAVAATDGRPVLVVTKLTNGKTLATMELDAFCEITKPLFVSAPVPANDPPPAPVQLTIAPCQCAGTVHICGDGKKYTIG